MRIEKLTAHIGAEVHGRRPRRGRVATTTCSARIREALLAHKVLFLRDQMISRADHVAFAGRFGDA